MRESKKVILLSSLFDVSKEILYLPMILNLLYTMVATCKINFYFIFVIYFILLKLLYTCLI